MDKILVYKLYDKNFKRKEILLNEFYHTFENCLDKNLISKLSFERMNIKIVNIY